MKHSHREARVGPTGEWLDPLELAEEFKVPVRTLYAWRARGLGPEAVRIGKHLRYSRSAIDQWVGQQISEQREARRVS
jgi:predicted DNA-binding transcriptional regulator AlpA